MAVLSRKALLALEAVIDVALHARPNPVQARDITARQGVPQRYLEQVMQSLVRAHILRGVRGPQGGYRLARERRRIRVIDIIEVIEPIENIEHDIEKNKTQKNPKIQKNYSALGAQIIAPFHQRLCGALVREIGETTIDDLCAALENKKAGLDSTADKRKDDTDFTI